MNKALVLAQEVKDVIKTFINFEMIKRDFPEKSEIHSYLAPHCMYQATKIIGTLNDLEKIFINLLLRQELTQAFKTPEGLFFDTFLTGATSRRDVFNKTDEDIYKLVDETSEFRAINELFHNAVENSRLDIVKLMVETVKIIPTMSHAYSAIVKDETEIVMYLLSLGGMNKDDILFMSGFDDEPTPKRKDLQVLLVESGARIKNIKEKTKPKGIVLDERYDFIRSHEAKIDLYNTLSIKLAQKEDEKSVKI